MLASDSVVSVSPAVGMTIQWIARAWLFVVLPACSGLSDPELTERPDEPVDPSHDEPLRVELSQGARFYDAGFGLELRANAEDAVIFYTTDGSLPDPESALAVLDGEATPVANRSATLSYEGPIQLTELIAAPNDLSEIPTTVIAGARAWKAPRGLVQKAAVIRAVAVRGQEVSKVVSGTYFIDQRERERYSLPVVSLMTDRAGFFDEESGIYVTGADSEQPNYAQRGADWERVAHLELFDTANARPVAQAVGVRIHGDTTRRFPQKSLRLYARGEYGESHLQHRFFPTKDQDQFKRLVLRNGGNDWSSTLLRDATLHALVSHLPLATQHAQPAVVFINGEFWGIHHFRDRLDEHHLELHYGAERSQVTILEADHQEIQLDVGNEEDRSAYVQFLAGLDAGVPSTPESIDEHIALSELLDYTIVQCYAGNSDWPGNNIRWWRYGGPRGLQTSGPLDGRWRWLLYDVDRSFGADSSLAFDMVEYVFEPSGSDWQRQLFREIVRVEPVRNELIQRLAIHLATTFHPHRVQAELTAASKSLEPEIAEHIERWTQPSSVKEWRNAVARAHEFAELRPDLVRSHVVEFFDDVTGTAELHVEELRAAHGLTAHTLLISPETPGVYLHEAGWSAEVFAGVPLVLESDITDLSTVLTNGNPLYVEASPRRLTLVLEPGSRVTLTLPAP